eukprot:Phypoly_transcript_00404.p1 GENE.Phypoly_transcript_00404~~Phypoly_transcript_00404.p1  ORF type:complete len:1606 (+),score=264.32 Phypoly_transcript_00404:80-4897(+)
MQRKDKEKGNKDEEKKEKQKSDLEAESYMLRKAKNTVVDWKLDFNDKRLNDLYFKKYNPVLVTYLRVGVSMMAISFLVTALLSYLYNALETEDQPTVPYEVVIAVIGLQAVTVVASYVFKIVRKHVIVTALATFCLMATTYGLQKYFRRDTLAQDPDGYPLAIIIFQLFTTVRVPIKYAAVVVLLPLAYHILITVLLIKGVWYYQIALMQAVVTIYVVGVFSAYSLEKRAKFDFVCEHLMEVESENLYEAISRDVSLLRNIFPKNLSDELEMQMTKSETRQKRNQNKRLITYKKNANVDDDVSPPAKGNPLVKIISSFTSRNENAGWKALSMKESSVTDSPPQSHPRTPRKNSLLAPHSNTQTPRSSNNPTPRTSSNPTPRSSSGTPTPRSSSAYTPRSITPTPRPSEFTLDILSPRSDTASAGSTPRDNISVIHIDISSPRSSTKDLPIVISSPPSPPHPPSSSPKNSTIDVTPRSAALLSNLPARTLLRKRSVTDRADNLARPTPRSVIPIYHRNDTRWSTTALPSHTTTTMSSSPRTSISQTSVTSLATPTTGTLTPHTPSPANSARPNSPPHSSNTSSNSTSQTSLHNLTNPTSPTASTLYSPNGPPSNATSFSIASSTPTSSCGTYPFSPTSIPPNVVNPMRVPPLRLPSESSSIPPTPIYRNYPARRDSSRTFRPRAQTITTPTGFVEDPPFSPTPGTPSHFSTMSPRTFSGLSVSSSYSSVPPTPLSHSGSGQSTQTNFSAYSTHTAQSAHSALSAQSVQSNHSAQSTNSSHSSNSTNSTNSSNSSHGSSCHSNVSGNSSPSDGEPNPAARGKRRLSIVIPSSSFSASGTTTLSPVSHTDVSPSATPPVYSMPPIMVIPPSPMGTPPELPPSGMPPRSLTSSGRPLNTHHGPELYTFFNGAQHADGTLIALSHAYADVTVVLADIVGFTALSSTISPQELVDILNTIFSMFDDIMEEFQLEKIRTIGDAYLCVANMSIPLEDHQNRALEAAYQMLDVVQRIEKKGLNLRVGIASGPLIAGVTGITKWNYDIFGNALVEATLMETSSPPGFISVTRSIYEMCQDNPNFTFEESEVEGAHGPIDRYEVTPTNELQRSTSEIKIDLLSRYCDVHVESLKDMSRIASPLNLDLLEAIDTERSGDDIPLTDLTLGHDHFKLKYLKYTKEGLESVLESLTWRSVWRKFKDINLEREFEAARMRKTHSFLQRYVFLLVLVQVFFTLIDMFQNGIATRVWAIGGHSLQFALLVFYVWFIRHYDEKNWSECVHFIVLSIIGACAIAVEIAEPDLFHIHRIPVVMATLSICMRLRPYRLMIIIMAIGLPGSIIAYRHPIKGTDLMTIVVFHYLIIVSTFITQAFVEKSFRSEFLIRKLIHVNVLQHRLAQHRAKLLLHNIIPQEIIPRLQHSASNSEGVQGAVVELFEEATMMFVNIVNLETITAGLDEADTFNFYNEIFTQFDEATIAYGLEKIKTINSVYMVAAGLPRRTNTHAEDAMNLAIELHHIASTFSISPHVTELRVGIATGPVVAGIIGKKKYSYDCWSDTTNTASRMESNGFAGCAQVTPAVYELLKDKFSFTRRDNVYIKGKGEMSTYYLNLDTCAGT